MALTRDDNQVRKLCAATSDELWSQQSPRVGQWREIAEEMYPVAMPGLQSTISGVNQHHEERLRATNAAQTILKKGAAGFSIHLTSPARPWFELGPALRIEDDNARDAADKALETLTDGCRAIFEASGIYNQLDKMYEHLLAFGTACMLCFPKAGIGYDRIRATTLRFGTYALGVDADGAVNRVSRKFEYTLQQVVEAFGLAHLPQDLKDAFNRGDGVKRRYTITNLIEPNNAGNVFDEVAKLCRFKKNVPYRSVYWADFGSHAEGKILLAVRPLWFNPIIAPRLEMEAGDVWGRGCGIDALPVARILSLLREDGVNVTGNLANPALLVDSSLQDVALNLDRGGLTYWNAREGVQPTMPAIPVTQPMANLLDLEQLCKEELNEIFLVSRFAVIDALKANPGVKTATEVNQLVRENMGLLGAIVTGLDKELLDPLVNLIASYAIELAPDFGHDVTPLLPVTEQGSGVGLKVRYVGEIHQAMKAGDLSAMERTLAFAGSLAQANPEVLDNLDADVSLREYADSVGSRTSIFKDPDEVAAVRQQRMAQQQQMMQAQMAQQGAATLKDGSGAVKQLSDAGISPEDLANGLAGAMGGLQ